MHDNNRVRAFMGDYLNLADLMDQHPACEDIIYAMARAQTDGDTRKGPLAMRTLCIILSYCPIISTQAVGELMRIPPSSRTAQTYALAARTASKMIGRLLDQRPWMEASGEGGFSTAATHQFSTEKSAAEIALLG